MEICRKLVDLENMSGINNLRIPGIKEDPRGSWKDLGFVTRKTGEGHKQRMHRKGALSWRKIERQRKSNSRVGVYGVFWDN